MENNIIAQVPNDVSSYIDLTRFLQILANSTPIKQGNIINLNLTISDPPTQAEVQSISDKVDILLSALRNANILVD